MHWKSLRRLSLFSFVFFFIVMLCKEVHWSCGQNMLICELLKSIHISAAFLKTGGKGIFVFFFRSRGKERHIFLETMLLYRVSFLFTHTIFHFSSPIRSWPKSCSVKKWKTYPKTKQNRTEETSLSSDTSTENWTGGSMFFHYVTKVYITSPSFSFATQTMNERI